jgi:hypothetical protein
VFSRRLLLQSAAAPYRLPAATCGFPDKLPFRALFPLPTDGASVNPPDFGWWRATVASSYRLIVRGKADYEAVGFTDPVHLPNRTFPAGDYSDQSDQLQFPDVVGGRGEWRINQRREEFAADAIGTEDRVLRLRNI